tara:strand:+ start:319 stop:540 length:222 start_codon:yes stop_codon:yes gene_type:complete
MDKLLKEIFQAIKEIKQITKSNNELLGFVCSKIAPNEPMENRNLDIENFIDTSLEMSEMFDKYDIMPEEFGIS